jgi:hypothetical protein
MLLIMLQISPGREVSGRNWNEDVALRIVYPFSHKRMWGSMYENIDMEKGVTHAGGGDCYKVMINEGSYCRRSGRRDMITY